MWTESKVFFGLRDPQVCRLDVLYVVFQSLSGAGLGDFSHLGKDFSCLQASVGWREGANMLGLLNILQEVRTWQLVERKDLSPPFAWAGMLAWCCSGSGRGGRQQAMGGGGYWPWLPQGRGGGNIYSLIRVFPSILPCTWHCEAASLCTASAQFRGSQALCLTLTVARYIALGVGTKIGRMLAEVWVEQGSITPL